MFSVSDSTAKLATHKSQQRYPYLLDMNPEALSSRMLASINGYPVSPAFQASSEPVSSSHLCLPASRRGPPRWKIELPFLTAL